MFKITLELYMQPASAALLKLLPFFLLATIKLNAPFLPQPLVCNACSDEFGPPASLRTGRDKSVGVSDLVLFQDFLEI